MTTPDVTGQFFDLGTQYYVVGRYSVFAQRNPVAANILHHAVEMLLKGALAKTKSLKQLERFKHDLPRIWRRFKTQFAAHPLNQFDAVIAELHRFESLRYPDKVLREGMESRFDITRAGAAMAGTPIGGTVPTYVLCLEDIDLLVAEIFRLASRNTSAYLPRFPESAVAYTYEENMAFKPPS